MKNKITFTYKASQQPQIKMSHTTAHEGLKIYEYYEACKNFARAIGFSEETILKAFDRDFAY